MDASQDTFSTELLEDAATAADSLRPGQKLGRYTLLTPIAQGGMARVWAARQVGTRGFQKLVAIKTIMPALAADAEFERMFQDEARIAAAIHHPNVAEILDLGEVGAVLFLAMEWVDGVSLLALIKARPRLPLPDPIAIRLIADACAGLHAAHEIKGERGESLEVVHRDVSPHNILVGHDGNVKVADFGVAKAMGLEHAPTVAGQLKGKIAYMSPEQALGDVSVDRRSDIFSLGAVLYECLTGQRAWAGANDVARLQNLLSGNIIPPRQVRSDLPPELETILGYCLALDPSRRYQNAEQLRVALEQFLISRKLIVSAGDISAYVGSLCGRQLDERRARIRQAASQLADDTTSGTNPGTAQSYSGVSVQGPRRAGMRRTTATAITLLAGGITIAGLLGIVAIRSIPSSNAVVAAPTPSAQPPAPAPTPAPVQTVTVNPTPADAVVELDGNVTTPGKRSFPKPAAGETRKVVVRAQGYEPTVLAIGGDTAQLDWNVELLKTPVAEPTASASASATASVAAVAPPPPPPPEPVAPPPGPKTAKPPTGPTPIAPPPATTKPGGKPPGKPPVIPANPF